MTGIVLWESDWNEEKIKTSPAISLEYAYVSPATLVRAQGVYDWKPLDELLKRVANRQHQSIIRFYYTYPGKETEVPDYIKARSEYKETTGTVEGKETHFPDWSFAELESFHLDFFQAFAKRYDGDPRLAFLQVGFGLWGEYHIYQGPNRIGHEFPSRAFQKRFFEHLGAQLKSLRWSVSIDAASDDYSPLAKDATLRAIDFGAFDDSFMIQTHDDYNASMWKILDYTHRYAKSPHGGEISYASSTDQKNALSTTGVHGRTYAGLSEQYKITYMLGNDQPHHHSVDTIRKAGLANGYRFRVLGYRTRGDETEIEVINEGIAPIYYDAYFALDQTPSTESLKGLLPGKTRIVRVPTSAKGKDLRIQSPRLVSGQVIEFAADL